MTDSIPKGAPYLPALDYISNRMAGIDGFFTPLDAGLFLALDLAQKRAGIGGDLGEVGVLHGRTTFLMAHLSRPGERVHGVDVFDLYWPEPPYNLPGVFTENALKLGFDLALFNMITADSTQEPQTVVEKIGKGRTRLFHVDGDHRLRNILADAKIALDVTSPDGVIVFDDTFAHLMPEVTEGLIRTFMGRTDFVPLALSPNKAYFCPPGLKSHYAAYLIKCLPNNLDTEVRRFLDHWVITFSADKPVVLCHFDEATGSGDELLHRRFASRNIDFSVPP